MRELVFRTAQQAIDRLFLFDPINEEEAKPRYEIDPTIKPVMFITETGKMEEVKAIDSFFELPLHFTPDSTTRVQRALLDCALANAKNKFLDSMRGIVVCSNDTFPIHYPAIQAATLPQSCAQIWTSSIIEIIRLNNLPKNSLCFLPDPEFFGLVAKKNDKVGGFCLPTFVWRVDLSQNEIDEIQPDISWRISEVDKSNWYAWEDSGIPGDMNDE